MKMTTNLRKVIILLVSILCAICTFIGVMSFNGVNAIAETIYEPKTIEDVSFNMISGAQIRISEKDETSGIRFGAKLSVADYEGLKANGYKSLRFGMIIAPAEYADEENAFTVDSLFSKTDAKYNWPVWNGEKWENPMPSADKKTVINIYNTKMTLNDNGTEEAAADDYYEIKGSITKIQDDNLWKEFVGVGYIQATDANGDHYIVAAPADNERSIANIATVWQDGLFEEIYNGPTDARVKVVKEQSRRAQKVYGDKLESKFTYKGMKIIDVSPNSTEEWIYEGVSNVTALYDKNFRQVKFENVTDGVKLVNAPVNGEHDFYAVTENGNFKFKLVGATHQISDYAGLNEYIKNRTSETYAQYDYAVLLNDIDCAGKSITRSALYYRGHFNGLGHAIKDYTSNSLGLFGGQIRSGAVIENVSLYFTATSTGAAALGERAIVDNGDNPYIRNLYVKITPAEGVEKVSGLFGDYNQSYRMANVVVDVADVNIDYAIHKTPTNNATVTECYAIGAPTQGKLAAEGNNSKNVYINTISANEKAFYSDYAQEICLANGFSEYWVVKDNAVYFGNNVVIETGEIKETVYKDADFEINVADVLGEEVIKVTVNGEEKPFTDGKLAIAIADYELKVENIIRIIGESKVVVQPFVTATAVIDDGDEFYKVMTGYAPNSASASGNYIVLGKDITLPATGTDTANVWYVNDTNANNTWKFRSAHFNGLGHVIDCKNVTITGGGLFGDIRFSTLENFAIINAKASSDKPIIARWAFSSTASAELHNIYAECDYGNGTSVGLVSSGNAAVIDNCIVKISNASGGYALSTGVSSTQNCYTIGSSDKTTTNLDSSKDKTVNYETDAVLFADASTIFTFAKGFNSYWQVKAGGVYFGSTLVISANANA